MSTNVSFMDNRDVIVIKIAGEVGRDEVHDMRSRVVAIAGETSCQHFIMDISELQSIEKGSAFAVFELGEQFAATGFPYQSKTAVIMPRDPLAKEQAEFLHTVEINRGRGALQYVDSIDEALAWFD